MILQAIRDRLVATPSLGLVVGTNLFIDSLPAADSNAVMLRYHAGGMRIDHEKPGFFKVPFLIVVRNDDHDAAENLALAITTALASELETHWDAAALTMKYLRARTAPYTYPRLLGNNWENSTVYDACYVVDGS